MGDSLIQRNASLNSALSQQNLPQKSHPDPKSTLQHRQLLCYNGSINYQPRPPSPICTEKTMRYGPPPFNVLVLPYRRQAAGIEYAVFYRPCPEMWQFIAGGGEDDENPEAAARREAAEEGGIKGNLPWMSLDSCASVPRTAFPFATWPDTVFVIPEYCFAVDVRHTEIQLSEEHSAFAWLSYNAARNCLTWDSNKVALWELQERLQRQSISAP